MNYKKILAISLILFLAKPVLAEFSDLIKVDQIGYRPSDKKVFMVVTTTPTSFVIKNNQDKEVYSGKLKEPINDKNSGDTICAGEFTELKSTGEYYVNIPGIGDSYKFEIKDDVYTEVFYKTMRSFYLQRCGTVVDGGIKGVKHDVCHLDDAEFYEDTGGTGKKDVTGGWHDAGDYGKYIPNSGITCGTLLWAFELYSKNIETIKLDIPESDNKLPDFLDEVKYNLDWFLKMQRDDGAVYFKVAPKGFGSVVMPEKEKIKRYLYRVSSIATGNFAAVMAIAARVYKPYLPEYAVQCSSAAEKAWLWLKENPAIVPEGGFDDPVITSGYEGDKNDLDERFWAAAELFRTTGKKEYNDFVKKNYTGWESTIDYVPDWQSLQVMGMITYCLSNQPETDIKIKEKIKADTIKYLDTHVCSYADTDGYKVMLKDSMYYWGSNAVVLNGGMLLLFANKITKQQKYLDTAIDQLHYILGRNTLSKCFITGVGDNPVVNPHFGPSMASRTPWPGLVTGGVNAEGGDGPLNRLLSRNENLPIAKRYIDIDPVLAKPEIGYYGQTSFVSNEPCISYNAPLEFVLAALLPLRK